MVFDAARYTVGWVCALHTELVAARCQLDEEYDESEYIQPENDNNAYILGRIGKHDIVLASLPSGEYGLSSGTSVARDMVRTFTNVKIGLMVGIAGGAPLMEGKRRQDIRLGDIVVSIPTNGESGVYQYDYGKAVQEQTFQTMGRLNSPPQSIRTVLSVLRSNIEMEGHNLEQAIEDILKKRPKLRKAYDRPEIDHLYRAGYLHKDAHEDCSDSCTLDNLVARPPREECIEIHYGNLASANTLMRDASVRDDLANAQKILCFEMEAAGLMNQMPFLVIRGICDYSDTHKNKVWQGYAALTAATYTKKLLSILSPSKVLYEPSLSEFQDEQGSDSVLRTVVRPQRSRADRFALWLTSLSQEFAHHTDFLQKRLDGTGLSILQDEDFSEALESERFISLEGPPGCGKTILMATLVESWTLQNIATFSFWSSGMHNHAVFADLIVSLLMQCYNAGLDDEHTVDTLFSDTEDAYATESMRQMPPYRDLYRLGRYPNDEQAVKCLGSILSKHSHLHIVIDGLDDFRDCSSVITWLHGIMATSTGPRLIVTCRPGFSLRFEPRTMTQWKHINLSSDMFRQDIVNYVQHRLSGDDFSRWAARPHVLDLIEKSLTGSNSSSFKWIACQVDELSECQSPIAIREQLKKVPWAMSEYYKSLTGKIRLDVNKEVARVIMLLMVADCEVSLETAADLVAVDLEGLTWDTDNRMPHAVQLVIAAGGFIRLRKRPIGLQGHEETGRLSTSDSKLQSQPASSKKQSRRLDTGFQGAESTDTTIISFSDPHMKAFFSTHVYSGVRPGQNIATACLVYLLHCQWLGDHTTTARTFPAYKYAVSSWQTLYMESRDYDHKGRLALSKFLRNNTAFGHQARARRFYYDEAPDGPLQIAAALGEVDIVKELLRDGADSNVYGGRLGTALQAAATSGHMEVTQVLIRAGATPGVFNLNRAIELAEVNGHSAVASYLKERKA